MCAQRGRCSVIGDGSGCRTLVPLLLCVHSAVAVQLLGMVAGVEHWFLYYYVCTARSLFSYLGW